MGLGGRKDYCKLKQENVKQAFPEELHNQLITIDANSNNVKENWASFTDAIYSASSNTFCSITRKHQDWFDENDIGELLKEKQQFHKAYLEDSTSTSKKSAFNNIKRPVQCNLERWKTHG